MTVTGQVSRPPLGRNQWPLTGQFRVNGGPWLDIPDTVTIAGTEASLEVAEARAHLVNH